MKEKFEEIEKEIEKKEAQKAKRKRKRPQVSGKGVFKIQEILNKDSHR